MVRLRSLTTAWPTMRRAARLQPTRSLILARSEKCSRPRCLHKQLNRASSASTTRLPNMSQSYKRGGDIRRITLGQLASHSSGLPRVPQQYETWHRGRYTWPDFVRFLNSWKAVPNHEPGQQYLYSDAAMVLLRVALERRFNTRLAALMHQRLTGPLGMTSTALPFAWPRR